MDKIKNTIYVYAVNKLTEHKKFENNNLHQSLICMVLTND